MRLLSKRIKVNKKINEADTKIRKDILSPVIKTARKLKKRIEKIYNRLSVLNFIILIDENENNKIK